MSENIPQGPEGQQPDRMPEIFEELIRTLRGQASLGGSLAENSPAAPPLPEVSQISLRYQDRERPFPMVDSLEDMAAFLDGRVRPALDRLIQEYRGREDVEYVGLAAPIYAFPQDKFDFSDPESAAALVTALESMGVPVDTGSEARHQDFFLGQEDCFDNMRRRADRGVWRQAGLAKHGIVVTPVVRFKTDDPYGDPRDRKYNQPTNILFDTDNAIFLSGVTLVEGLCTQHPSLHEGYAVNLGMIADYIAGQYNLDA